MLGSESPIIIKVLERGEGPFPDGVSINGTSTA